MGTIDAGALPQTYEIEHMRYYGLEGNYHTTYAPVCTPDAPIITPTEITKTVSEEGTYNRAKPGEYDL